MAHQEHDDSDDAHIDAWHDGWFTGYRGPAKANPHPVGKLATAWEEGRREGDRDRHVRVVMPARPEGYYHQNPNGEW